MNTTYFLNLVAGNLYGTKTTPGIPSEYWIGLSTTTPTVSGTNVSEPAVNSTTSYKRVKLSNLSEPTNGVVQNTENILFDESTSDWGSITSYVVFDSQTGGNLLCYGTFTKPKTIAEETVVLIKAGELKFPVENASA